MYDVKEFPFDVFNQKNITHKVFSKLSQSFLFFKGKFSASFNFCMFILKGRKSFSFGLEVRLDDDLTNESRVSLE